LGVTENSSPSTQASHLLRILTPIVKVYHFYFDYIFFLKNNYFLSKKLYTAKQSIRVTSEAVECLGGLVLFLFFWVTCLWISFFFFFFPFLLQGYMEETILPRLLRDSQVGSIWEGTTNILSLDVIRVITSSPQHFDTLCQVFFFLPLLLSFRHNLKKNNNNKVCDQKNSRRSTIPRASRKCQIALIFIIHYSKFRFRIFQV